MKKNQKQPIYAKEDRASIESLFDSIATTYDTANCCMSCNIHTIWNKRLAREVFSKKTPSRVADLCAGTGEIASRIIQYAQSENFTTPNISLVDFSAEMLALAKKRLETRWNSQKEYLQYFKADVHTLPFDASSFDFVTCAYGIRNLAEFDKCFNEVYRVLRPGGTLGILELTRPENTALRFLHRFYLKGIIPLIGKFVASNGNAYSYLSESIAQFVDRQTVVDTLARSGFSNIRFHLLSGGITTLFLAEK